MTHTRRQFARYASLTVTLLIALTTAARSEPPQDEFRRLVQSDWQSQEKRWGRKPEDPESIRQALSRGERLGRHLSNVAGGPDVAGEVAELEELRRQVEDLRTLEDHKRLALYRQIRSLTRNMALKNPLLGDHPIVFMKRRRFICQMLHEYLGYFYDYGDIAGGGLYVLTRPGHSLQNGLWASNPDGTNPVSLFGNYTRRINACFQPRSIPGSDRIVFVAGAHHANVGGAPVVLDPNRVGLDAAGHDSFESLQVLTPEVCFPEAPGWPGSYFHSPWPLSEDVFLVAFSFDPLPGMGPKVSRDTETGLYLFDRFGNLELLYREPGISCMYPIPLAPRPVPPVVVGNRDPLLGDEAEVVLADVQVSHQALPAARPIAQLRIFQVLPKSETHVANQPRLGYANAESARMLLGTVPVETDGSAYFRVPARKPLYFQAVDVEGRAVQGMRSVTYFHPGERRGCVGCHQSPETSPATREVLATQRAPSVIQPGPDGSRPWNYTRLVQPLLDAHCVA